MVSSRHLTLSLRRLALHRLKRGGQFVGIAFQHGVGLLDGLDLAFGVADRLGDGLRAGAQHGAEEIRAGLAAEAVDVLAHAVAVAFELQDVEAALDDVVGELAAHGGERVEAAGLALVEDDVVDERLEQHQALEVARVGELRVEAGVVEDLATHGIAQQVVAGLQAGELVGVAP